MYEIKDLFLVLHVFHDHVIPAQTYPIYAVLYNGNALEWEGIFCTRLYDI
jgi:hypothetical protein